MRAVSARWTMDARWFSQCVERDGALISEWYDSLLQGWWIQAGENSEAVRFFPHQDTLGMVDFLAITEWLKECREYRLMSTDEAKPTGEHQTRRASQPFREPHPPGASQHT